MNGNVTNAPSADSATVTPEGELLRRVYRRLVPLHASLAESITADSKFRRTLMHEIMDVLNEIDDNPQFRVASDAEHERWLHNPTPEEQAAKERNQATLERFMRAREERRAEAAAASATTAASDV